MPRATFELVIDDADPMETSRASESLLAELDALDFSGLDRADEPAVGGTRSGTVAAVGTLVGLFSSPLVLKAAVDVVKSWLTRQERGAVTITCGDDTLTVANPSKADQEALVAAFVKKHTGQ
ncbi:hypothetical protein ALI144C_06235 [Actinosynnema sp. ALI-1.44]|uniref:hypothetical protein n=1 Tax=Actinosynnema sp. ALI-1.44 TaxID=1933779 RepID=UPI00097C9689|nr:hypothetical protein [Actinosynnema sp. ALI-1.44]ONI88627.1 hypothetical protein ALI144C_06235 [Actinosynnema sp. ALI-1.44]